MWWEVYRWYNTRFLGARNLVLERRATPRFDALESIGHYRMSLSDEVRLPASDLPIFWSMKCGYTKIGVMRKMLTRVPRVNILVDSGGGATRTARVIPDMLVSPVMGSYLPGDLTQFAAVFQAGADPGFSVSRIRFAGNAVGFYSSPCEVELLRPVVRHGDNP